MMLDRPLTVAVAGYFLDKEYDETLWCSLIQDDAEPFDLLFVDPYCSDRRKQKVEKWNDFARGRGFRAFWFPYKIPPMPRRYDWAIWNTPFLITDAERVFRYQQWRFISEQLIEFTQNNDENLAFQRNARVMNIDTAIDGYLNDIDGYLNEAVLSDGRTVHADNGTIAVSPRKKEFGDVPCAAYGDWCINVDDFIAVNGIDEIASGIAHYEDIDFEIRWSIAHLLGKVRPFLMVEDAVFRVEDEIRERFVGKGQREYKFGREQIEGWVQYCPKCQEMYDKLSIGEVHPEAIHLGRQNAQEWYKCPCGGVFHQQRHSHYETIKKDMRKEGNYKAPIGIDGRFGRNLEVIRSDCQKLISFEDRVNLVNESWLNPRYLK